MYIFLVKTALFLDNLGHFYVKQGSNTISTVLQFVFESLFCITDIDQVKKISHIKKVLYHWFEYSFLSQIFLNI